MPSKSTVIKFGLCLSLLLPVWQLGAQAAQPQELKTIPFVTDIDRYCLKLLELVNQHLDTPYKITPDTGAQRTQGRYMQDVASGQVDLMWAATDQDIENMLQPVRVPLLKGLLGHRIFLIRRGDQARFDRVKTLADLQQIKLGQGTTWADTKILEANHLQVVKTNKYPSLLYMLDGGRFDAFPRGVQEPWSEVNATPGLSFAVEKHLMLVYKMPFYFFVSKSNPTLARNLELGLNRAIADGSFDKVFFADPSVRTVIEKADLQHRLIFNLENPALPKETPVDRPELWLDVDRLQ